MSHSNGLAYYSMSIAWREGQRKIMFDMVLAQILSSSAERINTGTFSDISSKKKVLSNILIYQPFLEHKMYEVCSVKNDKH